MPTGQVTGLASGIDWQETIQLMMQIESMPMVQLEDRKEVYESKLEAWQSINSKLLSLKSTMQGMDEVDEVLVKSASSSDTDIATVSAEAGAISGSYSLEVNQLARAEKWTHDGWADENTTPVNSSGGDLVFAYNYDGTDYTVNVPDGTTLAELAQLINNDIDNEEVTATMLNDGSGTGTAYHLVLTGASGADNTITLAANPPNTLSGFESGNWGGVPTQSAQNAQFRIDGYPSGSWIESESNEVSDAITGLTIILKSTNIGSAIDLSVANDYDAVKDKIQAFVDAYNEAVGQIQLQTKYNAETEEASPLFGNGSAINIKSSIQSIIASTIPGLADGDIYRSLSEAGVELGNNGMLEIDDDKLQDALEEDFQEVGEIFAFSSSSTSNNLSFFYRTEQTQGGEYEVIANYDAGGNLTSATINGHVASIEGDYIVGASGEAEAGMRIEFTNPGGGAGSVSATITLKTGAAVQINNYLDFVTDPIDGTVQIAEDGIEDAIESLDRQI
ncbi:flagellar filament capping protein FliD, partial [bacterium]|nr:flagellar filament capping protein FliD [bacterium]